MPTLVIVDDEREILEPLEKMLSDEGFSVLSVVRVFGTNGGLN